MEHVIEIDEDGKVHGNDLQSAIAAALNSFSAENGSNTPDFILATYLLSSLAAFDAASRARESWYGRALSIGGLAEDEARLRRFVGWLTADIPELHSVEVPRLAESLDRFLAVDGGHSTPSPAAPPSKS
jgi:hypothetical protein